MNILLVFYSYFNELKMIKNAMVSFFKDIQNICDVRDEREVHNENFKVIRNNVVATMNKVR